MLAPRFSIRTLIAILSVCAIIFLLAGMARRGEMWAWGVTIGAMSLAVGALAHAAWFGIVWLFAQLPKSLRNEEPMASSEPNRISGS